MTDKEDDSRQARQKAEALAHRFAEYAKLLAWDGLDTGLRTEVCKAVQEAYSHANDAETDAGRFAWLAYYLAAMKGRDDEPAVDHVVQCFARQAPKFAAGLRKPSTREAIRAVLVAQGNRGGRGKASSLNGARDDLCRALDIPIVSRKSWEAGKARRTVNRGPGTPKPTPRKK